MNINMNQPLIKVTARLLPGDQPLSRSTMAKFAYAYMYHSPSVTQIPITINYRICRDI